MEKSISIKNARENNLKNVSVEIPRDSFVVITGVSGSGKTSLAYNVLYGEAQRRFLQSLSSASKTGIINMPKPDVDMVNGLSPVISIPQKRSITNPRSSVATLTDLSSYVRMLYSILGQAHCPVCHNVINSYSINQMVDHLMNLPEDTILQILAPVNKIYDEDYDYLLTDLRNKGFRKILINGILYNMKDSIQLNQEEQFTIYVVVDEVSILKDNYEILATSIKRALDMGDNLVKFDIISDDIPNENIRKVINDFFGCEHNIVAGRYMPKDFSANDLSGACPTCHGLGTYKVTEPRLLIKDSKKSMRQNPFYISQFLLADRNGAARLYSLANHYDFDIDAPYEELSESVKDVLMYGTKGERYELLRPNGERYEVNKRRFVSYEGLVNYVNRFYKKSVLENSTSKQNERLFVDRLCPDCKGKKIKRSRLLVKIDNVDIYTFGCFNITELKTFLENIHIPESKKDSIQQLLAELRLKLNALIEIGLEYLNLGRSANSLSGGETQRIRLSTQIGLDLMGMIYILDEPSIGLHARDTYRIIKSLKRLKEAGNTVIVVEHDMDIIKTADYIIEIGPGAGIHGGEIVATGSIHEIKQGNSLLGKYLNNIKGIRLPKKRRQGSGKSITIKGAKENNLKDINVNIPLHTLICVTGVSGSGKSSIVNEVLYKAIISKTHDKRVLPGCYDSIEGIEYISDIRNIDQTPIGRSSRSNVATYLGIYDSIRKLYANTEEAKNKGYNNTYFSFNTTEGRCENCNGEGRIVMELQFVQDITTVCPVCKGQRYKSDILSVKYRGKNIAEVLDLTVEEALEFFKDVNGIYRKIKVLNKLGLGYLKLGQSSSSLSGGEAQRIKLGKELGKLKKKKDNLYLLDEPTTGLHLDDIEKLILALDELVNQGNTVLVIEHNLDLIKVADYIIDLGPEAGEKGGELVAEGSPEKIIENNNSYTGKYLKEYFYDKM